MVELCNDVFHIGGSIVVHPEPQMDPDGGVSCTIRVVVPSQVYQPSQLENLILKLILFFYCNKYSNTQILNTEECLLTNKHTTIKCALR